MKTYMRAMGCVSNHLSYKPELRLEYKKWPFSLPALPDPACLRPQILKYQISAPPTKTRHNPLIGMGLLVLLKNLRAHDGYS